MVFDHAACLFKTQDERLRGWRGHAEIIVERSGNARRISIVQQPRACARLKQRPSKRLPDQFLTQHRGIAGEREPGFEIDDAVADQLRDFAIEVLHAFSGA